MPSVRCASTLPPNVAHAIACVSPRVKRELPCTRGSNPPSQVIGLTVFVSRPSCRRLLIRMESLIAWDSIRPHARRTSEDCVGDGKKGTVSDEEIGNTHNSAITQDEKPKKYLDFHRVQSKRVGSTRVRPQGGPSVRSKRPCWCICALGSWAARPRLHEWNATRSLR